ncbi:unnamed protein product [Cuscuta epithymum]|uniref:Uncharacterized protein n=1 Tax=Cuscuta epithymum TaxID=186058 RepID=A0AAV0D4X9_9ASTE|nr:unnamed protein product [Cuscuta epithymum]
MLIMSIAFNVVEGRCRSVSARIARFDFHMLVLAVLALLSAGTNVPSPVVVPSGSLVVFDPGGTPEIWRFMEGANLKSNKVVEGLAHLIWSPQVVEEEDDMRKLRPPPEPPPRRNCASRVWKNVSLVITCYFQSNLVFPFRVLLFYVVLFFSNLFSFRTKIRRDDSARYCIVIRIDIASEYWIPVWWLAIRIALSRMVVSMSSRR